MQKAPRDGWERSPQGSAQHYPSTTQLMSTGLTRTTATHIACTHLPHTSQHAAQPFTKIIQEGKAKRDPPRLLPVPRRRVPVKFGQEHRQQQQPRVLHLAFPRPPRHRPHVSLCARRRGQPLQRHSRRRELHPSERGGI